jgi:phytanoyl-CoA hydroxylase
MTPSALIDDSQSETLGKAGPSPKLRGTFRDMDTLELHSSGGAIDPDSVGWLRPSSKDTPIEQLREQYNRDGYLWMKGVLPKEDVWEMRKTYFDYLPGLTKEGTPTRDGIFCGGDWRLVS